MSDLETIKRELKLDEFNNISNEQMVELLKLHGRGKVSVAQLEEIATMMPHFVEISREAAKTIAQTAAAAGASQQAALAEIGKTRDAILSLASHPKVTEDLLKLIIEKLSELTKQIERVNEANNSFFAIAVKGLALVGVGLLALIGLGIAGGKES